MMYDQALVIDLPHEEFMANFRYEVLDSHTNKWESLGTGDYDKFESICHATMVGVVRNKDNKKFSCMAGE
jgi:hypothetical protein